MKILILGLAKSGTTALAYKIHEALGANARLHFEPGKGSGAEDRTLHERITSEDTSLVVKNLVFPTTETRWPDIFGNAALYDRVIWIVRDPRDIIISNFFYHWFQAGRSTPDKFQAALSRTRTKEEKPQGSAFVDLIAGTMTENLEQLRAWQTSWYDILEKAAAGINERMFVLKYEDFVDGRLDGLAAYLGLDMSGTVEVAEEHRRVARTRGYGNWRRWFTEKDVEFFRPILSGFLDTMGYDAADWNLTPVERLPAEEGSKYMERLHQNAKKRRGRSLWRRALSRIRAKL
jgi:hypothetical protein